MTVPCRRSLPRSILRLVVPLAVALGLFIATPAKAAVITLTFTGTYDTGGETIFGLSGDAVPFNFQMTYNTALDTNTVFVDVGDPFFGDVATHQWHGYSASSIIGTSLTFGTQTWTIADLVPATNFFSDPAADFWLDADMAVSTPTRSLIVFQGGSPDFGFLALGVPNFGGVVPVLEPRSLIFGATNASAIGPMTISRTVVGVPEPSVGALLGVGLLLAGAFIHRRRAVRR